MRVCLFRHFGMARHSITKSLPPVKDMAFHFETQNVLLRPFAIEDLASLRALLNDPEVSGRRYLPESFSEHLPLSAPQVSRLIETWQNPENALWLAVCAPESPALVGYVYAAWHWDPHCPSVGVVIAPACRRQGYGRAVLNAILTCLFDDTPAHVVQVEVADWNEPGRAFAQAMGFQPAGAMRWAGLRAGQPFDMLAFDLLRSEWCARREEPHATGG
ncbi:MAG: hypothetical protein Fur0018_05450 [Anaerolineales bacterium]